MFLERIFDVRETYSDGKVTVNRFLIKSPIIWQQIRLINFLGIDWQLPFIPEATTDGEAY